MSSKNYYEEISLDKKSMTNNLQEPENINSYFDINNTYVTVDELAALTGYSINTVYQITRNDIPYTKRKGEKKSYKLSAFWNWVDLNKNKLRGPYRKKRICRAEQMDMF